MKMKFSPDAKVLGQLLLMQNVLINLPDEDSIFSFVCRGLFDIPGAKSVKFLKLFKNESSKSTIYFPIGSQKDNFGSLQIELDDFESFYHYKQYVQNFVFMVQIILEERKQRRLNISHSLELEKNVVERTKQLSEEIKVRTITEKHLLRSRAKLEEQNEEFVALNNEYKSQNKELTLSKEKAEESEQSYKSLTENSQDFIMRYDRNHRHIYMNVAAIEVTGISREKIIGKSHKEIGIYDADQCKFWGEKIEAVFITKEKHFEQFSWESNGEIFYLDWRLFPEFDDKGNVFSVLGVSRDISSMKKAEIELKIAKEMAEESDRLKSAFLANMSHEIRTPMNGILGFTELLSEPNLTGKEKDKYIDIIAKSGDRMLNTVNDIIDISKIDSGQVEVVEAEINIKDELESLYEFFMPETKSKGLDLKLKNDLMSDELLLITDKGKFNSIVTNLIKNAIKFTDKGSIEIAFSKRENSFQCSVEDTGKGIPKKFRESVFKRFEQLDSNEHNVHQGSGLGLAISKSYIEMLGGEIGFDSEFGEGCKFYFALPWKSSRKSLKNNSIQKSTTELKKKDKTHKILIAEDDESSFELLKVLLKDVASEIIGVPNGEKAVEQVRNSSNIELVLMDLNMPGVNGYEATKQIRKFNKDVVIIAQTAYALTGDCDRSIEAGCNDYISKPINKKELLIKIAKHL